MKTYDEIVAPLGDKQLNWTIGDNSGTGGRYLNPHNFDLEINELLKTDPMQHPCYYVMVNIYTEKQRDEVLQLVIDWNNKKLP